MLRAPADGMLKPDGSGEPKDPRAARIKQRKARKLAKGQPLRVATRELGFVGVVKLELDGRRLARLEAASEECAECQRLNGKRNVA